MLQNRAVFPLSYLIILHCACGTPLSAFHVGWIFCCFHMLQDPNNAALNMGLDVSFRCLVFNRDTAKCGIA